MEAASEDITTTDSARHEGYLTKKGKIRRNWNRRWCVVENGELKYFKNKPKGKAKESGAIPLVGSECSSTSSEDGKYQNSFQIVTKKRTYFLFADSAEDLELWKKAITKNGGTWNDGPRKASMQDDAVPLKPASAGSDNRPGSPQTEEWHDYDSQDDHTSQEEEEEEGVDEVEEYEDDEEQEEIVLFTPTGESAKLPNWDPFADYNPLLDGYLSTADDLIRALQDLSAMGVADTKAVQAKLQSGLKYLQALKLKNSTDLSFEQFSDMEYISLIGAESLLSAEDVLRWHPYGIPPPNSDEDLKAQLINFDQVLCFVSPDLYSKKEAMSLLRMVLSFDCHLLKNNFATILKNKLLTVKNCHNGLSERIEALKPKQRSTNQPSTLPNLAQVMLTAIIDLLSGPLAQVPKTPEGNFSIGIILEAVLKSLRAFPLLSLSDKNKLDPLSLSGILKLQHWLVSLLDSSESLISLENKQRSLQTMIELALATGSLEVVLFVLSKLLLPSNAKHIEACFPLDIGSRLQSLNNFWCDLQPSQVSLGVSAAILGVWENYSLPSLQTNSTPELIAEQARRTMTCDGQFLYIHDNSGLRKVGTGYHNTSKSKTYRLKENYFQKEKLFMVHYGGRIYFQKPSEPEVLIGLSCDTLEEVPDLGTVTFEPPTVPGATPSSQDPQVLLSDGFYFYILKQNTETGELCVDFYNPTSKPLKFIKRVDLLAKGNRKFKDISAERFLAGSYLTNGRHLMAVVPLAVIQKRESPEKCTIITWNLETGEMVQNCIEVDMVTELEDEVYYSRALYTACYDPENNIIWSFAPFSKKMRIFQNVGLPKQQPFSLLDDIPITLSTLQFLLPRFNIAENQPATPQQTAILFLGNALRLAEKSRPYLEELGLPDDEVRPTFVPFAVQPSVESFNIMVDVLEHYVTIYLKGSGGDQIEKWILLCYLKLLRVNVFQVIRVSEVIDLGSSSQRFHTLFQKLLSSVDASNFGKAVIAEVMQTIVFGLDILYPEPAEQIQILTTLLERGETSIFHSLALKLNTSNFTRWFVPSAASGPHDQLLQSFIEKLVQRVELSAKSHIEEFLKNPSPGASMSSSEHSDEIQILWTYQKQLLFSCHHSSNDEAQVSKSLWAYGTMLISLSTRIVRLIKGTTVSPGLVDALQSTAVGILLPYFLVGYPFKVSMINQPLFLVLSELISLLDEINGANPDLTKILSEFQLAEAKEIKFKGLNKKIEVLSPLPFLIDLERTAAWSAGKMASACIQGLAISTEEIECRKMLHFELFRRGIPAEFLANFEDLTQLVADQDMKFLVDFIEAQPNSNGALLYETVHKMVETTRPPGPSLVKGSLGEKMLQLEKTVIAVLLKHFRLTQMAEKLAESLKDSEVETAPFVAELTAVWNKAKLFRKWVLQEIQARIMNEPQDKDPEKEEDSIISDFLSRGRFLLSLPCSSESLDLSVSGVLQQWNFRKAKKTEQAELTHFFSVWKNNRQQNNEDELGNEIVFFLKSSIPIKVFFNCIINQANRCKMRIEGLKTLLSLLSQISIPQVKFDATSTLASALRKADVMEHKQNHSILDDIETSGQEKIQVVLDSFNELFKHILAILQDPKVDPTISLPLLDLWNFNFKDSEQFLNNVSLVPLLLKLHKHEDALTSKPPVGIEPLREAAWLSIRALGLQMIVKKPTESKKEFVRHLFAILSSELQNVLPILSQNPGSFNLKNSIDLRTSVAELKKENAESMEKYGNLAHHILLLVFSLCRPIYLPLVATAEWSSLLLSVIRKAPLRIKLVAFRLLRILLPYQTPESVNVYQQEMQPDLPPMVLLFLEIIGIAFESSSELCTHTIQNLLTVGTTHDVFSVASEAVTLIRLLMVVPTWKDYTRKVVTDSIDKITEMFSGTGRPRSRTRTVVTQDMLEIWVAMGSLCVLGGSRDILRLGGRVSLDTVGMEESDILNNSHLGTIVDFHRMSSTARVIQDSYKEPVKIEVTKLTGVVEISPDLSGIDLSKLIRLFTVFLQEDEAKHGRNTLFYQFRSSVLKMLVEALETGIVRGPKSAELVPDLIKLALQPSGFKTILKKGHLQEMSQCLHEVLLSEKETAKVKITFTTQSSTQTIEQRVQRLISEGYIAEREVNLARLAFSQFDLNGDGVLSPAEVIEATGIDMSEEEQEELRVQLLRADRNGDGTIDFLEFLMMGAGLTDFSFPDENSENELKPTLQVLSPPLVAGSYELFMPSGQDVPKDGISGNLVYGYDPTIPKEDLKNSIILLDEEKRGGSLIKQTREFEGFGVAAAILVSDKGNDKAFESKIPVVFISRKNANTIRSGLDATDKPSSKQKEVTENDSQVLLDCLREIGFPKKDAKKALVQFGNSVSAAAGFLFQNTHLKLKTSLVTPKIFPRIKPPSRGSSKKNKGREESEANEAGEPTYLHSVSLQKDTKESKLPKSAIVLLEQLNLNDLRGEVIRVEREISIHFAHQAIAEICSKWESEKPISIAALGAEAHSLVRILKFTVTHLHRAANKVSVRDPKLEDLFNVFVSLVEEKNSPLPSLLVVECLGTILIESRLAQDLRLQLQSNLAFALSIIEILTRAESFPKHQLISNKLIGELIKCLETTEMRTEVANSLTLVFLQIPRISDSLKPNMTDLSAQLQSLQLMLHKQFVSDRKKDFVVGSIYLQALSELVAIATPIVREKKQFEQWIENVNSEEQQRVELISMTFRPGLDIINNQITRVSDESIFFPTVTGSRFVTKGKFFYEVKITRLVPEKSRLVAQIGWCNSSFKCDEAQGSGVGDDEHSWAYDGGRLRKWHKGRWSKYSNHGWDSGDIVGCAIDLGNLKMEFYLNGEPLGLAFVNFEVDSKGLCPAASFGRDMELEFNFGSRPFEYPILGYQPLEQTSKLADFDNFSRNYHLVNYLFDRTQQLPVSFIKAAISQFRKTSTKLNNKINLKLVSTDGKSDLANKCENILKDDASYYSTDKAKNVNIVLSNEDGFIIESVYLEAHRALGVINPIHNALVFISDQKPDASLFTAFDNDFNKAKWDALQAAKKTGDLEPVAYIEIPQAGANVTIKLDAPKKGRYILLKLLSSCTHNRLDLTYVAFFGIPGPILDSLPEVTDVQSIGCNNDNWTPQMDQELTSLFNNLSQKLNCNPLALTEGQLWHSFSELDLYPLLKKKKPEALLYRSYILWLFNHELNSMLYWVDLSQIKYRTIAGRIRELRSLIFFEVKTKFLHSILDKTAHQDTSPQILKLNRLKALRQKQNLTHGNPLDTLFGQAFTQLHHLEPTFLQVKEQGWNVVFVGEGAIDSGGPYRESITLFCSELQSSALRMLQKTPNGQHNVGLNREMWIPAPSADSSTDLAMFEFLGKILGLVLYTRYNLGLDLASLVWKPLVGQELDISDLRAVDAMCVQSLEALRTIDQQGVTEETFSDVFMEVFTVHGSDGKEIELVPNGETIPVTFQNRFEWASLVEKCRIHEVKLQVDAMKRGLASIVPLPILTLFDWKELKVTIEGKPHLDLNLLKSHTVYRGGYTENDVIIQTFWKVIESLSDQEHSLFLRFTWGRSRLPIFSDQFVQELKVAKLVCDVPDKTLPLSHTCFFELELPEYSSFEVMREKICYAITECQAIDADFNPRNAEIWEQ